MAIYQLLPSLAYGDAIGNETMVIKQILKDSGYKTDVFALGVVPRLEKECKLASELLKINIKKDDILIYHFAVGCSQCVDILNKLDCVKIMLYHNITPSSFFCEYNNDAVKMCDSGRKELASIKELFDYCLADSEYNKQELLELGYNCPIDILSLLIPFEDYDKTPSDVIIEKYMNDGYTNLLFCGRIVPNKKHEDIIKVFNYYKKNINSKSRLILVGNTNGMELYYEHLQNYIKALDLEDVIFTGHIEFDEILAYYCLADVFLCMSEHEGFCVPLVEAMHFNIPVIAYNSSSIPWVLGDSGVIVDNKNSILWSKLIDRILQDKELREEILDKQIKRLEDFSYVKTKELLLDYLSSVFKKVGKRDDK